MISIAMTTYNGEKYLQEQIDSILAQTIQDFELVVCDDCSTDGTWDILTEYKEADPRISLYRNKENLGVKSNFEKAMSLCKGEYIALSDQDDIWMPNHLEVLLNTIGDKLMSCGYNLLVDEDNRDLINQKQIKLKDCIPENELYMAYSIILYRNPFQGASMLIHRRLLDVLLPIHPRLAYHDSWIAILTCFYGGFSFCDSVVTRQRKHKENVTKAWVNKTNRLTEFFKNVKNPCFYDRTTMLSEIEKRVSLSDDGKKVLSDLWKIVNRNSSVWGRILNFFFKIRHYQLIYGFTNRKWCI